MARRFVLGALLAAGLILIGSRVAIASGDQGGASGQFSIQTVASGNEFFAVGRLSVTGPFGTNTFPLGTGHRYVSCYYSDWALINEASNGARYYAILIMNACANQQVFPSGAQPLRFMAI